MRKGKEQSGIEGTGGKTGKIGLFAWIFGMQNENPNDLNIFLTEKTFQDVPRGCGLKSITEASQQNEKLGGNAATRIDNQDRKILDTKLDKILCKTPLPNHVPHIGLFPEESEVSKLSQTHMELGVSHGAIGSERRMKKLRVFQESSRQNGSYSQPVENLPSSDNSHQSASGYAVGPVERRERIFSFNLPSCSRSYPQQMNGNGSGIEDAFKRIGLGNHKSEPSIWDDGMFEIFSPLQNQEFLLPIKSKTPVIDLYNSSLDIKHSDKSVHLASQSIDMLNNDNRMEQYFSLLATSSKLEWIKRFCYSLNISQKRNLHAFLALLIENDSCQRSQSWISVPSQALRGMQPFQTENTENIHRKISPANVEGSDSVEKPVHTTYTAEIVRADILYGKCFLSVY